MNDDAGRSMTMHLEHVAAAAAAAPHHTDDGPVHGRFQETYTRHSYRPVDDSGLYSPRAARYQDVATSPPFMLPEASALLPTHPEEEEEEEDDDGRGTQDDDDHDDEGLEDIEEEDEEDEADDDDDDLVDLANRAFIATCQKFARQNYPEFRRRAPYSFLESWHLHSMYSKSQQILLGIPHAQPVVLLSGDDFMFTPQLVQQQHFDRMEQQMQFDWSDDDYDTSPPIDDDDDVLLVTARAPLPEAADFMDENTWMSSRHSHQMHQSLVEDQLHDLSTQPLLGNGTSYHVTNPDIVDDHEDDDDDDGTNHGHEDDADGEQGDEPADGGFTLSPEIVHLYRSAQFRRPPSTIFSPDSDDDSSQSEQEQQCNIEGRGASSSNSNSNGYVQQPGNGRDVDASYQSLADMIPEPSAPPATEVVIPMPTAAMVAHGDYGSVRHQQHQQQQQHVRSPDNANTRGDFQIFYYFDLYHVSTRMTEAVETAMDRIQDSNDRQGAGHFFTMLLTIWRILFTCMEMVLADVLLGRVKRQRHQHISTVATGTPV